MAPHLRIGCHFGRRAGAFGPRDCHCGGPALRDDARHPACRTTPRTANALLIHSYGLLWIMRALGTRFAGQRRELLAPRQEAAKGPCRGRLPPRTVAGENSSRCLWVIGNTCGFSERIASEYGHPFFENSTDYRLTRLLRCQARGGGLDRNVRSRWPARHVRRWRWSSGFSRSFRMVQFVASLRGKCRLRSAKVAQLSRRACE